MNRLDVRLMKLDLGARSTPLMMVNVILLASTLAIVPHLFLPTGLHPVVLHMVDFFILSIGKDLPAQVHRV